MDLLYWSRHFRNMPGEGDLPVTDFMRAVAATGYAGTLSLEVFNDQFRGGSPRSIAVDGRRSLVALMDQVRRLEPDVAIETPDMPDRIAAEGVEFVEFAADAGEAERLDALFSALGFHVAGRHRSKAVTLYRQGGINLVVNTEREGFAHSSFLVRGTSAYAVGIRVDDARATVARAQALSAEIFEQAPGPGELAIPAIHGLGGGILYFIDGTSDLARVWEIEFEPVAGAAPAVEVGLSHVDHVAQTMEYEEMLSWGLFYTSIFQMRKTPMVDIVDPAGLVRSQAIGNADGSLRLTLNGAENRRTLAGHFIAETFGSAIQHIAFATDDIFAAAAALRENGLEPLAISRNYYDDLEARFGLDPDFADRLRDENILYDRDEAGEYFQIYSPIVGEGFFLEVVERRGGYDGYGGPNAPFRIAAQKRRMRPKGMPKV
jgi:4-hydroxyphenylpyruvate dioxygenase